MKHAALGIEPAVAVDRAAVQPLYRQLYEGYREAIVDGRLHAGQRVPSTRVLASELQISRLPVLNAFDQLLAEGYFESRVGAGTFVARSLPDDLAIPGASATGRPPVALAGRRLASRRSAALLRSEPEPWLGGRGAFRVSQPAVDQFPFRVWSRLVTRHSRNPPVAQLVYGDAMGHGPFREAIASYLRASRAVRCDADQIMIVSGSQQALEITARVLLDPGSRVWFEEPGYGGAHSALVMAGARVIPVPVDDEGLDVAAGIARNRRARAAYVTPSHQYPLGVTMSASRRLQLLEWARTSGSWIIEDDYDSEYRYESPPVASLQGLDRDSRVVYIGTFSKVLFPALRLGYVVIPADLVPRFVAIRDTMDICPPSLLQAVLTDFITEGHFARHLRRMRLLYRDRRSALVDSLRRELGGALRVLGSQAGMHLVATMTKGSRDRTLSKRAAEQGIWTIPLSSCYLGKAYRQGLVLGYGSSSAVELRDAVGRLRGVLESG